MTLYAGYRVEAVVDWIELEVELNKASNGGALNRLGRKELGFNAHFRPLDKGAGGAATRFCFRIQDPPSWAGIADVLQALGEEYSFAAEPVITGMEVSLDAYAKGASLEALAQLTAERYRFMQTTVSGNHRYSGRRARKHDVEGIAVKTLHSRLADGRNIVIGHRNAPLSQRLYVKTTDNAGAIRLPQERWRSRWELTLQGPEMPFRTLAQARGYRFVRLSKFFATRQPTENLSSFERLRMAANRNPGSKREKKVLRRWYSSQTVADSTANAVVYAALRKLTRRMNPRPRRGVRRSPGRNSVSLPLVSPRDHTESPLFSINYIHPIEVHTHTRTQHW